MEKAHEVLKNTFGFDSFRLEQEAVRVLLAQYTSSTRFDCQTRSR